MNRLLQMSDAAREKTEAKKVFEKDMLFATLDTKVRKISIPGRKPFLLSDTVGFIENIPHDLIKAFRSTLAEVKYADVILIVIDFSDPHRELHRKITEDTLMDLDVAGIPRIYVYNKVDLKEDTIPEQGKQSGERFFISAKSGYGLEDLLDGLQGIFQKGSRRIDVCIPFSEGELLNRIHKEGEILSETYEPDGTHVSAIVPASFSVTSSL